MFSSVQFSLVSCSCLCLSIYLSIFFTIYLPISSRCPSHVLPTSSLSMSMSMCACTLCMHYPNGFYAKRYHILSLLFSQFLFTVDRILIIRSRRCRCHSYIKTFFGCKIFFHKVAICLPGFFFKFIWSICCPYFYELYFIKMNLPVSLDCNRIALCPVTKKNESNLVHQELFMLCCAPSYWAFIENIARLLKFNKLWNKISATTQAYK